MTRPPQLIFVAGTGTEVGKTWLAAATARCLRRRGVRIAARKPAQSFDTSKGPTDAELLAEATGEEAPEVCLPERWYELPMAPPMAADALQRPPFTIGELVAELSWPPRLAIGLVEGAGGPRSPIAHDGDNVDLAHAIGSDLVVLVADAGLGTINAVRLSVGALAPLPVLVFLNRYEAADELHRRNREWLSRGYGLAVLSDVGDVAARLIPDAGETAGA